MAPKGATEITVCGPSVKVTANLLTECGPYGRYQPRSRNLRQQPIWMRYLCARV